MRFECLRTSGGLAAALALSAWLPIAAHAGTPPPGDLSEAVPAPALNESRILGIIPNYQTVSDPDAKTRRLTPKEKWSLVAKETFDPFNIASAGLASGFSQVGNQTPKYGEGGGAFGMRFGAAFADFAAQNVFSAGALACLLHQDPRYFRKGTQAGVLARVAYSVSRIAITRKDSGGRTFNSSGIFGMMLGIAASNAYYPSASVGGPVMAGRIETSLLGGVIGNLMSEFWPDVQRKLFHKAHSRTP